MHEKLTQWREDHEAAHQKGTSLEFLALKLKIQDLPFACRPHWFGTPTLDWVEWNLTLEEFQRRVKEVADRIGPADKVTTETGFGSGAPNLVAKWTWKEHTMVVQVRAMSPEGCKVDPRTEYREASHTELHPECKAVLDELEDYGS